ncbi:DNA-binding winged helix-turn-helix (wHTH) protein [Sphingomonas sp. F9_3S_D5_B_2]
MSEKVTSGRFRFDRFVLDPADRLLCCDEAPVEINARYLDALTLLVSEQGRLVTKDRFMDEVWRGVPVTDEALTQCIRTLRRLLGDDAARPRFIETVPKHGYRFVANVEEAAAAPVRTGARASSAREIILVGAGGTIGGGVAGFVGGLFYGFAGASQPLAPGMGAISVLLVLLCVTILVAVIGGAGVAFGIAAAALAPGRHWRIVGGAVGGLIIGAIVKLLGIDAFNLLIGQSPGDITGPLEGLVLGGGVGLASWLATRVATLRRALAIAAVAGAGAGVLIVLLGGRMMGGSLDLLATHFAGSRLHLDRLGALFGEAAFGPVSQAVTAALEGALFAACVVGAMMLARRSLDAPMRLETDSGRSPVPQN